MRSLMFPGQNDVNVIRQSPIFNDLKDMKAPEVPFVANDRLINGNITLLTGYIQNIIFSLSVFHNQVRLIRNE